MPAVVNSAFYGLNSSRPYPVDDSATSTGDGGERLPENIIVDCNLRFPSTLGNYAYVAGVTVTPTLVTVLILAAASPDAAAGFVPLASVTLPKPFVIQRPYRLTPLAPGVGGWIVFGDGIGENFVGRFSTPRQGLLTPRCARAVPPLPVQSIAQQGNVNLITDTVTFKAGPDISIVRDTITLGEPNQAPEILVAEHTAGVATGLNLSVYGLRWPAGADTSHFFLTLSFRRQTTAPIPLNATISQIQAAFCGLSTVGANQAVFAAVTPPGGFIPAGNDDILFSIQLLGDLAGLPANQITVGYTGYFVQTTGVRDYTAFPIYSTTVALGLSAGVDEVQAVWLAGSVNGGTFRLNCLGEWTGDIPILTVTATDLQNFIADLSVVGIDNVGVSGVGTSVSPFLVHFTGALAAQPIPLIQADSSQLRGPAGAVKNALVFSLQQTAGRNVLAQYVGPCGTRPESNNCTKPGITAINSVQPDCFGNINIEYRDLLGDQLIGCGPGNVIDTELGLAQVCPSHLTLPPHLANLCSSSIAMPSSMAVIHSSIALPPPPMCNGTPYAINHDNSGNTTWAALLTAIHNHATSGFFALGHNGGLPGPPPVVFPPTYENLTAQSTAENIILLPLAAPEYGTLTITGQPAGMLGIGLILNYWSGLQTTWWLVRVSPGLPAGHQLQILRFNGITYVEEIGQSLPAASNNIYHLSVNTAPGDSPNTQTALTVTVQDVLTTITAPYLRLGNQLAMLTLTTTLFQPILGQNGIWSADNGVILDFTCEVCA